MLVLSRKIGESIVISGRITLTVSQVTGSRVVLAFDAPSYINIRRSELPLLSDEVDHDLIQQQATSSHVNDGRSVATK